jgi:hypothetical protein
MRNAASVLRASHFLLPATGYRLFGVEGTPDMPDVPAGGVMCFGECEVVRVGRSPVPKITMPKTMAANIRRPIENRDGPECRAAMRCPPSARIKNPQYSDGFRP